MSEFILEMKNITKEFPGVKALNNVTLSVAKNEIHALCGENGAGKSTLMKILSGVYPCGTYSGKIYFNGQEQQFKNIKDSENAGVSIIYQELALVKQMNISENIFLGNEITNKGIINSSETYIRTKEVLNEVGLHLDPSHMVKNLGIGKQQLVELAKAISKKAEILIFDEPTAALTETETENLLNLLKSFKEKGITCIYISHKLDEVFQIADRITVLRDGQLVMTDDVKNLNEKKVISYMVGREISERFPRKKHTPGEVVMKINNWNVINPEFPDKKIIDNISLNIRKGEILGIAGLMGSGRTELAMSIFGFYKNFAHGEIIMDNRKIKIKNIHDAIRNGISYLTEDRKRFGLNLLMNVKENVTLASLRIISKAGIINQNEEIKQSQKYIKSLSIKTPSAEQKVKNLSGGNQQKVVLGKWLMTVPRILILDEPTRGIDVGAKHELYNIMNRLVENGVCVVMISSELPEIIGMSDRIIVMHEGRVRGELSWKGATQEKILSYATGGNFYE